MVLLKFLREETSFHCLHLCHQHLKQILPSKKILQIFVAQCMYAWMSKIPVFIPERNQTKSNWSVKAKSCN